MANLLLFLLRVLSLIVIVLKLRYHGVLSFAFCKNRSPNVSLQSCNKVCKIFVPKITGVCDRYLVSGEMRKIHGCGLAWPNPTSILISASMQPMYGNCCPSAHSIFNTVVSGSICISERQFL